MSPLYRFNSCPREGAIDKNRGRLLPRQVSTHAPARGQSVNSFVFTAGHKRFNSCPREGAIPTKEAAEKWLKGFNSCPREGAISHKRQNRREC